MTTQTQFFSVVNGGFIYRANQGGTVTDLTGLNGNQAARVAEAVALWEDVSAFTGVMLPDDDVRASNVLTQDPETLLWFTTGWHWRDTLSNDWTRVVLGDISESGTMGINRVGGDANGLYHEL